jgi:hypothetical protein
VSLTNLKNLDQLSALSQDELSGMLPTAISRHVSAIPESIYAMTLEQLEKKLDRGEGVDVAISRIRIAFWLEFERHFRTGIAFNMSAVYGGVMNLKAFSRDILGNSYVLAYVISPPPSYSIVMDEMLHFGLQLQREILRIPHGRGKELNVKLLGLKNNIVEGIHNRIKGLPVAKSLHLSSHVPNGGESQEKPIDVNELDKKIKELEEAPIDVKPLRREPS